MKKMWSPSDFEPGQPILIMYPEVDYKRIEERMMALVVAEFRKTDCPACELGYPISIRKRGHTQFDFNIEPPDVETERYPLIHQPGPTGHPKRNHHKVKMQKASRKRNRK